MNTRNRNTADLFLIVIALIVLAGFLAFATGAVHAMSAGYIRPEGCHTYSVGAVFGGADNTEAFLCGEQAETVKKDKPADNKPATTTPKPADNDTPVIVDNGGETVPDVTDEVPTVEDNTPADTDTPAVEDTATGNPGNDKPVGKAGEKCNKNMCENTDGTTGEHGKSKND